MTSVSKRCLAVSVSFAGRSVQFSMACTGIRVLVSCFHLQLQASVLYFCQEHTCFCSKRWEDISGHECSHTCPQMSCMGFPCRHICTHHYPICPLKSWTCMLPKSKQTEKSAPVGSHNGGSLLRRHPKMHASKAFTNIQF